MSSSSESDAETIESESHSAAVDSDSESEDGSSTCPSEFQASDGKPMKPQAIDAQIDAATDPDEKKRLRNKRQRLISYLYEHDVLDTDDEQELNGGVSTEEESADSEDDTSSEEEEEDDDEPPKKRKKNESVQQSDAAMTREEARADRRTRLEERAIKDAEDLDEMDESESEDESNSDDHAFVNDASEESSDDSDVKGPEPTKEERGRPKRRSKRKRTAMDLYRQQANEDAERLHTQFKSGVVSASDVVRGGANSKEKKPRTSAKAHERNVEQAKQAFFNGHNRDSMTEKEEQNIEREAEMRVAIDKLRNTESALPDMSSKEQYRTYASILYLADRYAHDNADCTVDDYIASYEQKKEHCLAELNALQPDDEDRQKELEAKFKEACDTVNVFKYVEKAAELLLLRTHNRLAKTFKPSSGKTTLFAQMRSMRNAKDAVFKKFCVEENANETKCFVTGRVLEKGEDAMIIDLKYNPFSVRVLSKAPKKWSGTERWGTPRMFKGEKATAEENVTVCVALGIGVSYRAYYKLLFFRDFMLSMLRAYRAKNLPREPPMPVADVAAFLRTNKGFGARLDLEMVNIKDRLTDLFPAEK